MRTVWGWVGILGGIALPSLAAFGAGSSGPAIQGVVRIVYGPSPVDAFRRPQGLWVDPDRGTILVADTAQHRIAIFDSAWRCRGTLPFPDGEPRAMASDDRGRLFVVDGLSRDLEVMTPWGGRIRTFAPPVPGALDHVRPEDVQIGVSGRIYLLLGGEAPGLLVLDRQGRPLASWGFSAKDDQPLVSPVALAVNDSETLIAVADPLATTVIRIFDGELHPQSAFGKHGEGPGSFSLAADITWGPGETLWITDSIRHSISVFDDRGNPLGRIGGFGRGPGQFNYPSGCAFVAPDRLVVLERAGARFQVLEVAVPAKAHAEAALEHARSGSNGADSASEQGRYR